MDLWKYQVRAHCFVKTERNHGESLAIYGNLEANTEILKLHHVDFWFSKPLLVIKFSLEAFLSIWRISMLGLEAAQSGVQGHLLLHSEFQASLDYTRPYL